MGGEDALAASLRGSHLWISARARRRTAARGRGYMSRGSRPRANRCRRGASICRTRLISAPDTRPCNEPRPEGFRRAHLEERIELDRRYRGSQLAVLRRKVRGCVVLATTDVQAGTAACNLDHSSMYCFTISFRSASEHRRQPIVLPVRPAVFDDHVPAPRNNRFRSSRGGAGCEDADPRCSCCSLRSVRRAATRQPRRQ